MYISILIPVYNEEDNIAPLAQSLKETLEASPHFSPAEVIFINDGSKDGTMAELDKITGGNPTFKAIHLRRNYGQTAALMAGIRASTGQIIVPMDGDRQNDPADIPALIEKINEGYDVVSGWRKDRQDTMVLRRLPSFCANKLIAFLFNVNIRDHGCSLKAYRREFIESIKLYGEMHRFIPVYATWEGAKVTEIPVSHHPRQSGSSKYGIDRTFRVILDIIVLYFIDRALDRPIQFFGKIGLWFLGLSFAIIFWALSLKFFGDTHLNRTPLPLLSASSGLSGILFILLGVVAEIQSRIYFDVNHKDSFRVARSVNFTRKNTRTKKGQG